MLLQLMANMNKNKPKAPSKHSSLANFPSLLPTYSQSNPQFLSVIPYYPLSSLDLLSGTYPIADVPIEQALVLADIAHRLSAYLDIILRGLENAEAAYKEGGKQTMIWREELETCGEQQGSALWFWSPCASTDSSIYQRRSCRAIQMLDDGSEQCSCQRMDG